MNPFVSCWLKYFARSTRDEGRTSMSTLDQTNVVDDEDSEMTMWFRKTYSLGNMHVGRPQDLPVSVTSIDGVEFCFRMRTFRAETEISPQLCFDVIVERKLKPEINDMLSDLSSGLLPTDSPPVVDLPYSFGRYADAVIEVDRKIPHRWAVPIEIMPVRFQQYAQHLGNELFDYIKSFVKILRWLQGVTGRHNPYSFVGFDYSNDRRDWTSMPSGIRISFESSRTLDTSDSSLQEAIQLFDKGFQEPIAHELIREAKDTANINPRSSLLIAVTALETGLKHLIKYLVPNVEYVLDKLQSPPAVTMIQKVIPSILKSLDKESTRFPLNDTDATYLKKWIFQRNQVAHGTKESVDQEKLLEFIRFVRSVLYTIDKEIGHEWADSQVNEQ